MEISLQQKDSIVSQIKSNSCRITPVNKNIDFTEMTNELNLGKTQSDDQGIRKQENNQQNSDQIQQQSQNQSEKRTFQFLFRKFKSVNAINQSQEMNGNIDSVAYSEENTQLKKTGTADTPNNQQNNASSQQLVQQKRRPGIAFFNKFKSAYYGTNENQQNSFDLSNEQKIYTSFQNPRENNMSDQKNNKSRGLFNFLKAVALLRTKKVVPYKKKTKEEIQKLFRKAYMIVLAVIRLNKICEDIRNFGTSPNLFDVAIRNRIAVKKVLFPLSFKEEGPKENEQNKIDFPLIKPNSKIHSIWSPILLCLVFYSATVLPYRIAFQDDVSNGWDIFDYVIDGLFWIDLVINMFSTYYDDDNQLVKSRKVVILNYLKSWFIVDLICCIPIDLIAEQFTSTSQDNYNTDQTNSSVQSSSSSSSSSSSQQLKFLKLAKISRLYRILKITKLIKMVKYFGNNNKLLDFIQVNSGILRLVNLFFFVFVAVHFIGCMWYYEAKLYDFNEETWVYRKNLLDSDNSTQYLYSIYFVFQTITTVGFGDINAYTNAEIIMTICLMIFGVGFYSSTIGILSSVIQYMDSKQILFSRKSDIMNEYCNEMKIPNSVKKQLKEALQYTLDRNSFFWANQNKIFDQLPMNLKYEICMNIYKGVMKTFSFFNLTEDQSFIVRLVPQLRPLKLNPGDTIWNQKDVSDSIYLLSNGRVNYMKQVVEDIRTKERKSITFKTMINGSYFGEIDIIMDRKRKYRCQAETACELYYMTRQEYEVIIKKEFPHIHQKLKKIAFDREKKNEEALKALKKLLRQAKEATTDFQVNIKSANESPLKEDERKSKGRNSLKKLTFKAEKVQTDNQMQENQSKDPNQEQEFTPIQKFQRAVQQVIRNNSFQNSNSAFYFSENQVESNKSKQKDRDIIEFQKRSYSNTPNNNTSKTQECLISKQNKLEDNENDTNFNKKKNQKSQSSKSSKSITNVKSLTSLKSNLNVLHEDQLEEENENNQNQIISKNNRSDSSHHLSQVSAKLNQQSDDQGSEESASKNEESEQTSNQSLTEGNYSDSDESDQVLNEDEDEEYDDDDDDDDYEEEEINDEEDEDDDDDAYDEDYSSDISDDSDSLEESEQEESDESNSNSSSSNTSKESSQDKQNEKNDKEGIKNVNNQDNQEVDYVISNSQLRPQRKSILINGSKNENEKSNKKKDLSINIIDNQQIQSNADLQRIHTLKSLENQSLKSFTQFSNQNMLNDNKSSQQLQDKKNIKETTKKGKDNQNKIKLSKKSSKTYSEKSQKVQQNQESEYIFLKEEFRKNNKKMEILEEKFKNLDTILQDSLNLAEILQKNK
ncbi:cation channel family protein (macronuclear) [Tetrahymena thermophila SB210]|uniref:Cation channel family protein n=1 Tax=Tetrahymena thermophila (strain SB210) TaxID=312017 RepID=Q23RY3_TETTS|nr:cation channel family protein [Tetrahymena thermophila SB210]EAR99256.2 cation channel family protein [Tetrahymena thermophila SB210]|eukprot:XP_001019501.2 cation channel family protein [Tetrahymena thermophila SB210]